jgi:hypothetical protein
MLQRIAVSLCRLVVIYTVHFTCQKQPNIANSSPYDRAILLNVVGRFPPSVFNVLSSDLPPRLV